MHGSRRRSDWALTARGPWPSPWEWDLKRLGASLILAARDRGFSRTNAEEAVRAASASYREHMAELAEMTVLDSWYAQVTFDCHWGVFPER
jgi:hypothetical protein